MGLKEELAETKKKLVELETQLETQQKTAIVVHPSAEGFREKITPKAPDGMLFFECPGCGGVHYRHAGYVQQVVPFLEGNGEKKIQIGDQRVMICVACKRSFMWVNQQMYELTKFINLEAWEKTEREAHKATGPGGQC